MLLPLPSGPKKFRATVVKRYTKENDSSIESSTTITPSSTDRTPVPATRSLTFTIYSTGKEEVLKEELEEVFHFASKVVPQSKDQKKYAILLKKGIDGLITGGVFVPTTVNNAHGHRIYGSRFVYYVKNEGTPKAYEKSHFVAQTFDDRI